MDSARKTIRILAFTVSFHIQARHGSYHDVFVKNA